MMVSFRKRSVISFSRAKRFPGLLGIDIGRFRSQDGGLAVNSILYLSLRTPWTHEFGLGFPQLFQNHLSLPLGVGLEGWSTGGAGLVLLLPLVWLRSLRARSPLSWSIQLCGASEKCWLMGEGSRAVSRRRALLGPGAVHVSGSVEVRLLEVLLSLHFRLKVFFKLSSEDV